MLTGPLLYVALQGERKFGTEAGIDIDNVSSKLKKRELKKHTEVEDKLPENCYNADNRDLGFPPDYGRKLFALNKVCLLQPNWHKLHSELIVPWKNYQQLRLGTVVVANVSFRLHVLQPKDKMQQKQKLSKSFRKIKLDKGESSAKPAQVGNFGMLVLVQDQVQLVTCNCRPLHCHAWKKLGRFLEGY
ncbi:MAG: hypothetical protein NXY57DRAFT_1044559 [Lentinula lateritia]|nr:MAG: hypothetical protein NXY57DRAFT_1044559 [Lentinula lateritia]